MPPSTKKETKFRNSTCFKVTCGTLNQACPTVIYLKGKAKIKPTVECRTYTPYVVQLKEKAARHVKSLFKGNQTFRDTYIFSCDLSEKNMAMTKTSNIKYELYVKPFVVRPVPEYTEELAKLCDSIENVLLSITDSGCFVIS